MPTAPISPLNHPEGKGWDVTVNITALLSSKLGATETTSAPDTAPEGIVMLIDVSLQELTNTGVAFKVTTLPPCEAPKFAPVITTWLPTVPVVAEIFVMTGAGIPNEPTDTLSKVAVASDEVLPLFTINPTYTFCATLTVWFATSVQFTPSGDA